MKKFKVLSLFLPLLTAGILLALVWGMVGVQATLASPVEQSLSLPGPHLIDDFQGGVPATWFTYGDGGAGAYYAPAAVLTNSLTAQGVVSNTVLRVDYNIAGWGAGGGRNLAPDDWSNYDGLSLWFFGTNSGTQYRMVLSDNKSDPGSDTAERFATVFTDDFSGWQEIKLPWEVFVRDGWQPGGAPNDGFTLSEMWAYAIVPVSGSGTFYVDQIKLFKTLTTVDDFQGGVPDTWFTYGDGGAGAYYAPSAVLTNSLTAQGVVSNTVLRVDYNIAGWGAGGGRDLAPDDWSNYDGLSLWFFGTNSGTQYRIVLSDNKSDPGSDTAERFATVFTDDFSGWQEIRLPWEVFVRDGWQPGGAPNDGFTLSEMWAYALVPVSGSGTFYVDQIKLFKTVTAVDDFQGGVPATWFTYGDGGAGAYYAPSAILTNTLTAQGVVSNTVLRVDYNIAGWGAGGGRNLAPDDWSNYDGLSLWFFGTNSGTQYRIVLSDNKTDPGSDTAERFATVFTDDFSGWQEIKLPWEVFVRDGWQPGGAPNDGFTLSEMWAYALVPVSGSGTFYVDQIKLYSDIGAADSSPMASLSDAAYRVEEGGTATLTVTLNITSSETITVSYATADGSALAGVDYTAASGALVFAPGETVHTFEIVTLENAQDNPNKTVLVELQNPVNAVLTSPKKATLTIEDNDAASQPAVVPQNVWVVENYENGLPNGTDGFGNPVGFVTWGSASNTFISTLPATSTHPLALPIWFESNQLLQVDYDIASGGWGGLTHAFTNETADAWVSQDWTNYAGVSFWVYGSNSGGEINFDIFDNKTTTGDSCERFTYIFVDNFTGWRYFAIPFEDFARKGWQPGGAPDDGLTLTEVWGYAFGFPASVGARTNYVDNLGLMMPTSVVDDYTSGVPTGVDGFANTIGFVTWGNSSNTFITTTQVVSTSPQAFPLPIGDNLFLQADYDIPSGGWGGFTHLFTNEAVDTWVSQNWVTSAGVSFWVYGSNSGGEINLDIFDNKTTTGDSCERFTYIFTDDFTGWRYFAVPFEDFARKGWQPGGAPDDGLTLTEVWGYAFGFPAGVGARTNFIELFTTYGNVTPPAVEPKVAFAELAYSVMEGDAVTITVGLNVPLTYTVSVDYATADDSTIAMRDYLPVSGTLTFTAGLTEQSFVVQTLDDIKYEGAETIELQLLNPVGIALGSAAEAPLTIADNDLYNPLLMDDFERAPYAFETWGGLRLSLTEIMLGDTMALPGQGMYENVLTVDAASRDFTPSGAGFSRTFYAAQDWSNSDGLSFWYYGQNSGETITVTLQGNAQPDPGPSGWTMVWNDEFDGAAGAAVNDARWTHETGGWGWGNAEWEYYTDSTENSATDGNGNLAITARLNEDTSLKCDHSPNEDDTCFATSARLITAEKFEFAYGRVESRLKVPYGQGIWPAFWMLGNDIGSVGWPTSGEIDIMENVGYEPNIVHGTVHGPGYSGGSGIGSGYTLESGNFADDFHVFAIEWEPAEIRWYVDGEQYFSVTPENLPTGADWVFDHPFYLLLNVAVGGNWPGYPDGSTTFPQTMTVDYVRVYQAPDTAERHEATFTDDFSGWKKVRVPFTAFERSAEQPQGAPDDGFDPAEIWGYGFELPASLNLPIHLDQVALYSQVEYKIYLPLVRK